MGNPWGWLSSSPEHPQWGLGSQGEPGCSPQCSHACLTHRIASLDLGDQHKALGAEKI